MDCEKFEAAMMDELYGELDELTSAAMKRHASGCARCSALLSGFVATRRLATIPIVEPPAGLEERILAAAREADKVVPIRRRVAGVVSLAGRWAMRPQTAMAAVFLVMIGTSALLLTGRSARAPASAPVTVTEQGSPATQAAPVASVAATSEAYGAPLTLDRATASAAPAAIARADSPKDDSPGHAGPKGFASPTAPREEDGVAMNAARAVTPSPTTAAAPMAGAGGGDLGGLAAAEKKTPSPIAAAIQLYQAARYDDATKAFDALAPTDPNAELYGARSVREGKGCRAALARFDHVAQRAARTPPAWDALLEGALCYRSVGNFNAAIVRLNALLNVDSHKDRARAELDRTNQMLSAQSSGGAGGAGGATKAAAPAPAPPPASRPAASTVDQSY